MPDSQNSHGGLLGSLQGTLSGFVRYAHALAALADREGRDAAALYWRTGVVMLVSLIVGIIGYILVLIAVMVECALFLDNWQWTFAVLFLLGLAHVAAALVCIYRAKKRIVPIFEVTRSELLRDIEALKNLKP